MSYMRSEARARQILDCAKRVFAERGFHAANVSHICEAAGIGRGTLYQYFTNKQNVLEALLRETLARVTGLMERQSSRTLTFPAPETVTKSQVIAFEVRGLRELLAVVFSDDHMLRILLREAVGLDVDVEKILGEIDDALVAIVERDIVAAMRAGFLREMDAHAVAIMIVGGTEKLALAALRREGPVDLDRLAREACTLHAIGTLSDRVQPD